MVLRAGLLGLDTREMLDVAYVRRRKNAAHVSDEDALTAFVADSLTFRPAQITVFFKNNRPVFSHLQRPISDSSPLACYV